jgi:hypothetical protein
MPARAVLIVRHLDDPLPRVLGTTASPAWEGAARSALSARLRRAARPSAEPVPAGAIAVLFEDRPQLLAALAADWVTGSLANHWWWREFVRSRTAAEAVIHSWMRDTQAAPASLGLLADWGMAKAFVGALPPSAVSSLTVAVLRAWAAPEPTVAAVRRMTGNAAVADQQAPPAPWVSWASEAMDAGLTRAARLLLGVGLSLARAPAMTVRSVFWTSILAWLEAGTVTEDSKGPSPRMRARDLAAQPVAAWRMTPGTAAGDAGGMVTGERAAPVIQAWQSGAVQSTSQTGPPRQPDPAGDRHAGDPAPPAPGTSGPFPPGAPSDSAQGRYPPHGMGDGPGRSQAPAARVDDRVVDTSLPGQAHGVIGSPPDPVPAPAVAAEADALGVQPAAPWRVDTAFAGVFFLLNVALAAGLYGDFTRPATPGIPMSPWQLLALLGQQLLHPDAKWARPGDEDPVWVLLARLAGPAEPVAASQRASPAAPRAMRRWVRRLAERLRPELSLALGCAPDAVGDVLLRRTGQVEATATHVDVVLSLADLPICIRLAGLDRDPGWIPAAGRTVAFHFE